MDSQDIVLIDMDGVLADFDAEILRRLAERYSHIPLRATRTNFYIAEDYTEHQALVRALSDEKGFFDSLGLVENAIEGWQRIIDLGYHPRVCSSPMRTNPYSKIEKLRWLDRHFAPTFGEKVVDEAIITNSKYLQAGMALIDDRPRLKNFDRATWVHIIFDRSYNQHAPGPRLNGWLDSRLPIILSTCTDRP
jgi:5'-nucleotidase